MSRFIRAKNATLKRLFLGRPNDSLEGRFMAVPSGIDQGVLLGFVVIFARFELALKNAGFYCRPQQKPEGHPPDAKPDWDKFALSLRPIFKPQANDTLKESYEYLISNPPWRQVVINGALMWSADYAPSTCSVAEHLLLLIRGLRNNLFHGVSFSTVQGYDAETTKNLLRASIVVLTECLRLSPGVRVAFEEIS